MGKLGCQDTVLTGDPSAPGLPKWPAYNSSPDHMVIHLNAHAEPTPDNTLPRYEFLDSQALKK